MRRSVEVILLGAAISLVPAIAAAHISITSGPGAANVTQILKFGVGHGCEAVADTYMVKVEIPSTVTSVRPMPSDFGKVSVETDATGAVTAVIWTRAAQDTASGDIAYHELGLRAKLPDKPFTTLLFPTHQYCYGADGGILVTDWIGDGSNTAEEPAPGVKMVPAHKTGWNKFTVPAATTDLTGLFPDALIVWKGTSAFSPNATTTDLIKTTAGVTALAALAVGDEIWVKY